MNPISVIVVNFNAGSILVQCIRSVLSSTVPVELIVSDNGSTDGSITELRCHFPGEERLIIIENADNLGFAKANNVALAHASGDYILFLNPDCIIRPDTLEVMISVMAEDPGAGMAGCLIRNPDGSEQPGCRRSIPTPWRTFIRIARLNRFAKYHARFESYVQTGFPLPTKPVEVEAISGAFMLASRSAIEAVGPMDEGYFMHCEDLDWCMRFHQSGLAILFVPQVEIIHVGGVCSASTPVSVEYYKHKGMVRFYRKFFRYQYPRPLMWLVMAAIGLRFLVRGASYLLAKPPPRSVQVLSSAYEKQHLPLASTSHQRVSSTRRIMVTGATSLIGDYLLPELIKRGLEVHAISRNPPVISSCPGVYWHQLDITEKSIPAEFDADILIHLAPLRILPPLLPKLCEGRLTRLIAFSSTSLFTKYHSHYEEERLMAHGLEQAEAELADLCGKHSINWTIFRPTLVYHLGRDKNVSTIAQFIRRFGFFPLVGEGTGLRQPVHAEDLAKACMAALDNPLSFGNAYNLSGGETLSYLAMVERISAKIRRKSFILRIPLSALRLSLWVLSHISRYRHLTPEMANRINLDMCFSHDQAAHDLNFKPRRFLEPDTTNGMAKNLAL